VETDYGSLADLDQLLAQAHARGIGVIVDYVMNHSAALNPLFVNSEDSSSNPYRDWYVWSAAHPTGWTIYGNDPWRQGSTGWYFAPFWDQMPDFNLLNQAVVDYHHDNLRFWLNRGVDGFHFDAVGHLVEHGPGAWDNQPENFAIMGDVRTLVGGYQRRYMVCEDPPRSWDMAAPTACGAAFAFGHNYDLVTASSGDAAAIQAVASYFSTAPAGMATLVSNHDWFAGRRLYDQVGGDLARYRLVAATYLLQPGTPFIYYGEEIGLAGAANLSGDWQLRTPMSWTGDTVRAGFTTGTPFRDLSANVATFNVAAETGDAGSLLGFYKAMIALRKGRPSLARGDYTPTVAANALAFTRTSGAEGTLVVLNYGTAAAALAVAGLPPGATLQPLWPAGGGAIEVGGTGQVSVNVPARTVLVYGYAVP
jgi:glycosidase